MKRLVASILCLVLLACASLSFAAEYKFTVRNGDRSENRICITVDDCINTEMMQAIFELGQELEIPMTFFILGSGIQEKDQELWQRIAKSDCELGNHTYGHASLPKKEQEYIVRTLNRTQRRLDQVLGFHYPMQVMRPPYGKVRIGDGSNIHVVRSVQAAGYDHLILWDVDETDVEKCYKDVQNGSILLFHTNPLDYSTLQQLLPMLKADGYEFVTISQLLGKEPVAIRDFTPEEAQELAAYNDAADGEPEELPEDLYNE
jgi:peptidoglycan/xylan/chitin deacetylase (PgdA/CDA1 family)